MSKNKQPQKISRHEFEKVLDLLPPEDIEYLYLLVRDPKGRSERLKSARRVLEAFHKRKTLQAAALYDQLTPQNREDLAAFMRRSQPRATRWPWTGRMPWRAVEGLILTLFLVFAVTLLFSPQIAPTTTPTVTVGATRAATRTPTLSATRIHAASPTALRPTNTQTLTPTLTATYTLTPLPTATWQALATFTFTPSPIPATLTPLPAPPNTEAPNVDPTATPTATLLPAPTDTITPRPTWTQEIQP